MPYIQGMQIAYRSSTLCLIKSFFVAVSKSSCNANNDTGLSTKSFNQTLINTLLFVNKGSRMQVSPSKKAELPSHRPAGVQQGSASSHWTRLLAAPPCSAAEEAHRINSCRINALRKVVQKHQSQAGNTGLTVGTAFHTKHQACLRKT